MPTDPYVPETLDGEPRQLANLAPGVRVPPAGHWLPDRPGDLRDGQPTGPLFGSPGPDVGYALSLVERRRDVCRVGPHEHFEDVAAVIAELAMKRASSLGRAPVLDDVDLALELLGYTADAPAELASWRVRAVHEAAHDYVVRRAVVDAVPADVLCLPRAQAAARAPEVRAALLARVA